MEKWEIIKIVSSSIGIIAIPIVLAIIGNQYNKSIKEREIQGKFVELAVQILDKKPTEENVNIRKWAAEVINKYSGVKLSDSTKNDLIERVPLIDNEIREVYGDIKIPVTDNDKLRIVNNFLVGLGTKYPISLNTSGEIIEQDIKAIILHYTATLSGDQAVSYLTNKSAKASSHIIIDRDGRITQLIPFNFISWGTGKSNYKGLTGFNKFSINIQLVNAGPINNQNGKYVTYFGEELAKSDVTQAQHKFQDNKGYWHNYTEIQIQRTKEICKILVEEYDIPWILGHEDVSIGRKFDPGPLFPMKEIQKEILGEILE